MKRSKSRSKLVSSSTTELHSVLFYHSSKQFPWEYLFYQEHSQEKLHELLATRPHEFKHCKLKMERHDLAYAKPFNDPTSAICISGIDYVARSFPGDEVCVQILSDDPLTGKIVGLLNRSEECCTVICRMKGRRQLVTPVKNNMTMIRILQKLPEESIFENQLLVVKVMKWEKDYMFPLGVVTKVISEEEHFNEFLKVECGIKDAPPKFQPKCDRDEYEKRQSFIEDKTFTIDPSTAEDLDDAFSLGDRGEQYMIAIHITDVASYIKKDSKEDIFAKAQGQTFYPPPEVRAKPAFMFSREASYEYLSLLPGKKRKAISLVMMINKVTSMIESISFTLSHVCSNRRFSYEEADKIIQDCCLDKKEAPLKFSTEEECVAVAYCFTKVLRRFRLEGSWSIGQRKGNSRAHCMVEELMNFYNNAVAETLISNEQTRDLTPLRCHSKPDPVLLDQFKTRYSALLPFSPYLSQICEVARAGFEETEDNVTFIHVLTPVFQQMKALAQEGDYHRLVHLIISDEIHPTLLHMAKEFKEIQKKSVTLRSCSSLNSKLGHYALQLNAYTSASSPMRQYLDLILQRLLHSVLLKKKQLDMDYMMAEIERFCDECDYTEDVDSESSRFVSHIKNSSGDVTKLAVVDRFSPKEHAFLISVLLDSMSQIKIQYRNLKVVEQPEYNHHANSCTLYWKRRVYSFSEKFIPQLHSDMNLVIPISVTKWTAIISAVKDEDWVKVTGCLQDEREYNVKPLVNSHASPNMPNHFKEWKKELELKEVLQVQLGTDVINGERMPVVNLLTVNEFFDVCLEHARNPIKCFTNDTACRKSQTEYRDYKEYMNIWGKLCSMDTAYNAVEENNSVILEGVRITWRETTEKSLEGFFEITPTQVKDWSLEFDLTNCYLCIRLRNQCAEKAKTTKCNGSSLSDLQNTLPFTWVAHGIPTETKKQRKEKKTNKNSQTTKIQFQINHRNTTHVPPEVKKKETQFTVELIPKKIPYVQYEHAIDNIHEANDLVKKIATGKVLNASIGLEELHSVDEYMDNAPNLPPLNESQKRAVQEAFKNPFTVIQGPPGTGKTVVGVHITYHFYLKNKAFEAACPNQPPTQGQGASAKEKKKKKLAILYCGPSNKSVDIVAEQLSKVIKPLRIYCDQMEMREYPYPGSDLKLCRRSLRDEKPKEELRHISLMYLVRQPENSYSVEINNFEKRTVEFDSERYKKVLKMAQREELLKHDVILCTCSTALKPILKKTMDFRQILIDECAMATEPEAFIPLVSHNPEQIVLLGDHKQIRPIVTCDRVKELGMGKSLFERYMDRALMLDTQYRMHEHICNFPSNEFYQGKLQTGAKQRKCLLLNRNNRPTAILFGHVEGEEFSLSISTTAGNEYSVANELEAMQAVQVASRLISRSGVEAVDVAILTPYNAQMSKIKEILSSKKNQAVQNVNVCTIMKSQGSEWRYVIISTVRSCTLAEIEKERRSKYISKGWLGKKLGFITDPNQVNVAITRAQDGLCILGNRHLLNCSALWGRLLSHYQTKNCVLDSAKDIKVGF
ncbi:helicase with zinc finger domain 2 [Silurus meridionalis]|nr:helicase with zinc finger domain 2 [Silurus meridionalis]